MAGKVYSAIQSELDNFETSAINLKKDVFNNLVTTYAKKALDFTVVMVPILGITIFIAVTRETTQCTYCCGILKICKCRLNLFYNRKYFIPHNITRTQFPFSNLCNSSR